MLKINNKLKIKKVKKTESACLFELKIFLSSFFSQTRDNKYTGRQVILIKQWFIGELCI